MSLISSGDLPEVVVLNGGPMDGREHPMEGETGEICVVMTDGQQHRYQRTNHIHSLPAGGLATVFDWAGRSYGPK